jgi:hypothetical protein
MGLLRAALVIGLAVVATGCASPSGVGEASAEDWRRLPDAPLSPRDHAVVVGVGDRVLVVGGWELLCPPSADCTIPDGPLLRDGAVYDAAADTWTAVAAPPFGLRRTEYAAAAVGDTGYVLTGCADGPACDARARLLSYDLTADRWTDHGAVPGPKHNRYLTALGPDLVVYSGSDEYGEVADLVFDPRRSRWSELPDDPLPESFDRFMVPVGDELVLAGSTSAALDSEEPAGKLAARLDVDAGTWSALPDAPGQGYQLMPTDRGPLLNGHFVDSPGWLLDPGTWTWSELPDRSGEQVDLSGVVGRDAATYDIPNSVGEMASSMRLCVYDTAADRFVTIAPAPGIEDVYDDSSTAVGRDLFVYGGQRWTGEGIDGSGELVGDAWLWSPPAAEQSPRA